VVLLTTFLLTVLVDLTVAVEVGMVLAAFLFMKSMAELTEVKAIQQEMNGENGEHLRDLSVPPDVAIFSIRGAFFFAAVHKLMEIERSLVKKPRALVLDMSDVLHMDSSGLHVLDRIRRECQSQNIRLILAGIHAQPLFVLQKVRQLDLFDPANLQPTLRAALQQLRVA
jgi:sulfate permease, SulP family